MCILNLQKPRATIRLVRPIHLKYSKILATANQRMMAGKDHTIHIGTAEEMETVEMVFVEMVLEAVTEVEAEIRFDADFGM